MCVCGFFFSFQEVPTKDLQKCGSPKPSTKGWDDASFADESSLDAIPELIEIRNQNGD